MRRIFQREVERDRLHVNPTTGLRVPSDRNRQIRFATATEARQLLATLPEGDRPIWATALYAGLRRGELKALRVNHVSLEENVIHVESGWDDIEGEQETKGRNRRRVPISKALREQLLAHLMVSGRRGDDLLFGRTASLPFDARRLTVRADEAWEVAELNRITLHECRHTFASLMIAAEVNAKALCDYMGHSSIKVTFDQYGHLMPGNEEQAAGLLDTYLEGQGG